MNVKLEDDMNQLGRLFKWPVENSEGELIQFVSCNQLTSITEETVLNCSFFFSFQLIEEI